MVVDNGAAKLSTHTATEPNFYRFHAPHLHLQSVFGDDWFALKAEAFASFFGTPLRPSLSVFGSWLTSLA